MLTQVLEVLFNLSDVAIAGKFAGYVALGAVGSTTLLVSLFTGLLIGMGAGVNVAIARSLGLGDDEQLERTLHTSFLICACAGLLVCLVCAGLAGPMLRMLHTKDELIDSAVSYLRIYALGLPAMAIYNFGNGVLSASGDTKRPLIYLSVAGAVNVALNLFFVIVCNLAATGVAIASAIAQCLSALLIVLHLLRRPDACRLQLSKLRFHRAECRRVLMIGIPSGLQNAIFAVANLFVQVGVNSFDAVMVSGNSAAANADTLLFNMMSAFYTACASFISRNWGAGKIDRMKKELLDQRVLCVSCRRWRGRAAPALRAAVSLDLRQRAGGHRRGHAAPAHHGLFLRRLRADGRQHRRLARYRAQHRADGDRHSRLVRVPRGVDLHGVCLFPYDSLAVSAVYLLLGHHGRRGVPVFPPQL